MANCIPITLTSLDSSCAQSKGGIQVVYLIPYASVSGVTVGESGSTQGMITAISLASGEKFVEFKFRKNTAQMTSTLTIDEANGVSYVDTELTMLFTRMQNAWRTKMVSLAKGEVAAIVKDANGHYWYLGKNEGVVCSAGSGQTGQQKTDGNYYSVTLSDSADEYPFEVEESAVLAVIE